MFKKKIRLDVEVHKAYHGDNKYGIFEVWLKNYGTADADLYFNEATFTVIRGDEDTNDLSIKGETVSTKGMYSTKKRYRGMLKPSCSIRMPYYIKLTENSKGKLHLIEFEMPVSFGKKTIIHTDRIIVEL